MGDSYGQEDGPSDCLPFSWEERAPTPRPNIFHEANVVPAPRSPLAFREFFDQDRPSTGFPQHEKQHLMPSYKCSGPKDINQLLATSSSSQTLGYAGVSLQPNDLLSNQHLGCTTSWEEKELLLTPGSHILFHQPNCTSTLRSPPALSGYNYYGQDTPSPALSGYNYYGQDTPSPGLPQRDEHHLKQSTGCAGGSGQPNYFPSYQHLGPSKCNPLLSTSASSQTSSYAAASLQPNDHLLSHQHLAQNDHQPLQKPPSKDQKYRQRRKAKEQAKDFHIKTQDQKILRLTGELDYLRFENEMLRQEIIKGKNRRSH